MPRSKAGLLYSPKGLQATGRNSLTSMTAATVLTASANCRGSIMETDTSSTILSSSDLPKQQHPNRNNSMSDSTGSPDSMEAVPVPVPVPVPDVSKYGYGTAIPDAAKPKLDHNNMYGYEDASSDVSMYGYGDAAPDIASKKYDYGDAAPDDKYGYEIAIPDRTGGAAAYGEASSDFQNNQSSSTLGSNGSNDDFVGRLAHDHHSPNLPFEIAPSPQDEAATRPKLSPPVTKTRQVPARTVSAKMPRRSSMKKEGAPRRASISYTGEMTTFIPGEHRPVRRRTSISFSESNDVQAITPIRNLTDTPEQLWFQENEYSAIRQKIRVIVDYVDSVQHFPSKAAAKAAQPRVCTRGLERHLPGGQRYLDEKYNARDFVLDEQEMQRDEGMFDEDGISHLYQHLTVDSKSRAYERAQQDAEDIKAYTASTRRSIERRRSSMPF